MSKLEELYEEELDVIVKWGMLFVLKIECDDMIPAQAVSVIHRSRSWASKLWRGYIQEGSSDLNNEPKSSGRPSKLPEEITFQIRKEILESKRGCSTQQVNDMIVRNGDGVRYNSTHIRVLFHRWGLKQKIPRKSTLTQHQRKRKSMFNYPNLFKIVDI